MNKRVESWTCQELIRDTYHDLNQRTAIAASFLEVLLNQDTYGVVSDENQQEMLSRLQKEINAIRTATENLRIWFSANSE